MTEAGHDVHAPGRMLGAGRYRVDGVIGRGGFGVTYRADDRHIGVPVALKAFRPPFPGGDVRHDKARRQFLAEGRLLARFTHPSIVRFLDVFEEGGTAHIVMELLEGRSLADHLGPRGTLAEPDVRRLADDLADALTAVHDAGALHRDVNPANIVLTPAGRPVLVDFGIARTFAIDLTAPISRAVTPGYAPPEQYRGESRYGPPTDVYGLAATLYRALAGVAPVPAPERLAGESLAPPHRVRAGIDATFAAAVMDGLELDAGHRPRTMPAFRARLAIGAGPPAAVPAVDLTGHVPGWIPAARDPAVAEEDEPVIDLRVGEGGAPAPQDRRDATVLGPSRDSLDLRSAPTQRFDSPGPPGKAPTAAAPRVRLAPVVVPEPPTRRSVEPTPWPRPVAVPAVALVACAGALAPVACGLVALVAGLPTVATVGDVLIRRRAGTGSSPGFALRRGTRNLAAVLARVAPAVALGVAMLGCATALDRFFPFPLVDAGWSRVAGAVALVGITVPVLRSRTQFHASTALDRVVPRLVDRTGQPTERGWALWVVAAAAVPLGLTLTPDLWPLP